MILIVPFMDPEDPLWCCAMSPGSAASANLDRDWKAALLRLDGAYSENTLQSYRTDFRIFEAWCTSKDLVALPATPVTIAA